MLSATLATLEKLNMDMELKSFTLNHNRFNQVQLVIRFDTANPGDGNLKKTSQTITKKSNYHQKRDKLRLEKFNAIKNNQHAGLLSGTISESKDSLGKPSSSASCSGRKQDSKSPGGIVQDSGTAQETCTNLVCIINPENKSSVLPPTKISKTSDGHTKSTDGAGKKEKQNTLKSKISGVFSTSLATKKHRTRGEISYPVPVGREPYEFRTRPGSVSSDTSRGKDKANVRTPPISRASSAKASKILRWTGSSSSD